VTEVFVGKAFLGQPVAVYGLLAQVLGRHFVPESTQLNTAGH
jgi:hypothetical protein